MNQLRGCLQNSPGYTGSANNNIFLHADMSEEVLPANKTELF